MSCWREKLLAHLGSISLIWLDPLNIFQTLSPRLKNSDFHGGSQEHPFCLAPSTPIKGVHTKRVLLRLRRGVGGGGGGFGSKWMAFSRKTYISQFLGQANPTGGNCNKAGAATGKTLRAWQCKGFPVWGPCFLRLPLFTVGWFKEKPKGKQQLRQSPTLTQTQMGLLCQKEKFGSFVFLVKTTPNTKIRGASNKQRAAKRKFRFGLLFFFKARFKGKHPYVNKHTHTHQL